MQSSTTFNAIGAVARVALLACCAAMTGCVAIPIPTALPDPEPFTPETLAPIRIGVTTRDEVRALFADWNYTTDDGVQTAHIEPQVSDDGRYWVFGLPRQIGDVAFVGLLMYGFAVAPFLGGVDDNYENYWALVEFGDDDTVAAVWIASDKTPCRSGGICYHEGYLQMIADEAANATAPSRADATDQCVLYTYAQDDFDAPVTVTDGVHSAWVFAKTSFVRTEMPVGQQTVSASISIIPAWVASVPVTCAGNDAHYVALRQRDGLIEAKEEEASTGKRAIAKRFLVDRLVAASPRMELDRLAAVWTNCLAKAPCHQLAILDQDADANLLGITRDGGRYYDMSSGVTRRLLLHPGRYTVRSRSPNRADTFDLAAGHRYQLVNKSPFVGKSATWFEDVATKRVVAGAKSCSTDVDCPESACSKGAAKNAAVCEISELMCTNYDASPGTNVRRCIPQSAPR